MKKHSTTLTVFLIAVATLLPVFKVNSNQTVSEAAEETTLASDLAETINIDGDLSLTEDQNRIYWNPHSTELKSASIWQATLDQEAKIYLKTSKDEAGHVAAGAWWTNSFKSKAKIPLYTSKPVKLRANFRANLAAVKYEEDEEWLRIALACAVQRLDGSVVYTELDIWDSPNTLRHPTGNAKSGGDVVYQGGDVVEYKVDQIAVNEWTNYSLDLARYINSAWALTSGDVLESVYIVIEVAGTAAEVTVKVDDLWITKSE